MKARLEHIEELLKFKSKQMELFEKERQNQVKEGISKDKDKESKFSASRRYLCPISNCVYIPAVVMS